MHTHINQRKEKYILISLPAEVRFSGEIGIALVSLRFIIKLYGYVIRSTVLHTLI